MKWGWICWCRPLGWNPALIGCQVGKAPAVLCCRNSSMHGVPRCCPLCLPRTPLPLSLPPSLPPSHQNTISHTMMTLQSNLTTLLSQLLNQYAENTRMHCRGRGVAAFQACAHTCSQPLLLGQPLLPKAVSSQHHLAGLSLTPFTADVVAGVLLMLLQRNSVGLQMGAS
jgi:hypothetical protein